MKETQNKVKRYLVFLLGLFVNSLGVALITKADLGTSPISSIPYVPSLSFPFSLGQFTIFFSILLIVNLGVVNLLPLPALDGGRLVFILIEIIRGKPIAREKEGMVHAIGILLLMALMVFVLFNDVLRIIG